MNPLQSRLTECYEASVSMQQEMVALLAAQRDLVQQRVSYELAVQNAPREQKKLMQQALADFDRRAEAATQANIRKVQDLIQRAAPSMQESMDLLHQLAAAQAT
jgi:hypothetical protein